MTSKEFKEITGARLIEVAEDYQGYEDGVYADVIVDGQKVRVDAKFDNGDIVERLEAMGVEVEYPEDSEYLADLYSEYSDEIDAYFLDQALEDQRDDLLAEVEDAIEERKEEIANELAENLCWDNMELVIYSDWYSNVREHRQTGENEGMVVEKIGLSEYLWRDVLYDWGIEDWETADDKVKEQFKEEVLRPIIEEI